MYEHTYADQINPWHERRWTGATTAALLAFAAVVGVSLWMVQPSPETGQLAVIAPPGNAAPLTAPEYDIAVPARPVGEDGLVPAAFEAGEPLTVTGAIHSFDAHGRMLLLTNAIRPFLLGDEVQIADDVTAADLDAGKWVTLTYRIDGDARIVTAIQKADPGAM